MSLYTQFTTDQTLEKEGILLEYGTTAEGKPIRIRIARAGGSNVQYMRRMDVLVKPYRRQIQTETIDPKQVEKLIRQVYAETVVLGWENVQDRDGKVIAFSVDAALKLFEDLPDLFLDIQEQAQRAALFRTDVLEAEAGN